ncbi:hypothetical protein C8J56DRAFT_881454 [Mycena floridula]|nr:hypothetical protein C8J56DRAFT_881454 [Mycena floridula]
MPVPPPLVTSVVSQFPQPGAASHFNTTQIVQATPSPSTATTNAEAQGFTAEQITAIVISSAVIGCAIITLLVLFFLRIRRRKAASRREVFSDAFDGDKMVKAYHVGHYKRASASRFSEEGDKLMLEKDEYSPKSPHFSLALTRSDYDALEASTLPKTSRVPSWLQRQPSIYSENPEPEHNSYQPVTWEPVASVEAVMASEARVSPLRLSIPTYNSPPPGLEVRNPSPKETTESPLSDSGETASLYSQMSAATIQPSRRLRSSLPDVTEAQVAAVPVSDEIFLSDRISLSEETLGSEETETISRPLAPLLPPPEDADVDLVRGDTLLVSNLLKTRAQRNTQAISRNLIRMSHIERMDSIREPLP